MSADDVNSKLRLLPGKTRRRRAGDARAQGLGVHSCAIGLYETESEGTNAGKFTAVGFGAR